MDISIIIPCYNSGKYLPDALSSIVQATQGKSYIWEIIIIDDGSTDALTKELLESLPLKGYTVLYRANGGPGAARNTGVHKATGKYLIFLDSDNKLKKNYIERLLEVQQRTGADIIHCKSDFFGDTTLARFTTGPFDINKILIENYIDICCLVTRKVFDKIGGFDEERLILGFEDWEFFVRAYASGLKFEYVDEPLYDYRVRAGSVSQQHVYEHMQAVKYYVYKKHIDVLNGTFDWYREQYRIHLADRERPFRSFLKYLYNRYLRSTA